MTINSNYVGVPPRTNVQQTVHDNSGKIAVGGAAGAATFATLRNSAKVSNKIVQTANNARGLQALNKSKILKIIANNKFLNNPVMRKIAGPLAGFAAFSSVVGSVAKVADTCNYIAEG